VSLALRLCHGRRRRRTYEAGVEAAIGHRLPAGHLVQLAVHHLKLGQLVDLLRREHAKLDRFAVASHDKETEQKGLG